MKNATVKATREKVRVKKGTNQYPSGKKTVEGWWTEDGLFFFEHELIFTK